MEALMDDAEGPHTTVCPLLRCLLQFRQPMLTVPLHATDVLGQGTTRISRA